MGDRLKVGHDALDVGIQACPAPFALIYEIIVSCSNLRNQSGRSSNGRTRRSGRRYPGSNPGLPDWLLREIGAG